MANLYFDDNAVPIILRPEDRSGSRFKVGSRFSLLCDYYFFAVNDLRHEFNIWDFPEQTAVWAVTFIAAASQEQFSDLPSSEMRDAFSLGEIYWCTLSNLEDYDDRVNVLCEGSKDSSLFALATANDLDDSLFNNRESRVGKAWVPVHVLDERLIAGYLDNSDVSMAYLSPDGDVVGHWIKTAINYISE